MAGTLSVPTTEVERFVITEWRMEIQRRQAWIEGYVAGGDYMVAAMLRARGLTGHWRIGDDLMELIKTEGQDGG